MEEAHKDTNLQSSSHFDKTFQINFDLHFVEKFVS